MFQSPMKTYPILLLFILSCAAAQAQFNYRTDNGEVTITGYDCTGGAVIIPAVIDALPVTSIGDSAFRSCTRLTSVTVPDSVTNIGNSVFSGCTSLSEAIIPDSVTNIGSQAFSGCTSLTSITIPDRNGVESEVS